MFSTGTKVKTLDIKLDNATGAYYAGQPVVGHVVLDINEPIKLKAIKIQFFGECSVAFQDQATKRKVSEKYLYFDQVDVLYGNANGLATVELPAKSFSYPFVFTPPPHCASSYEHPFGSVRYYVKVVLQLPFLTRNQTYKKPFTLVAIADLNKMPQALEPQTMQARLTPTGGLFSFATTSGVIEMMVQLDRGAFVPGEKIMINADVSNGSGKTVQFVHAWLQQNLIFKTTGGGKKFVKGDKFGLIKHQGIKARSTQVWQSEPLQIPPLPPTNLGKCNFIEIQYLLTFHVSVDKKNEIQACKPLILGTIPLYKQAASAPPQAPVASAVTNEKNGDPTIVVTNGDVGTSSMAEPSAPTLDEYLGPPPSYNECASMTAHEITTTEERSTEDVYGGATTYRPLYPTYQQLEA